MTYPDNSSLEAIWDGPLGDSIQRYTFSAGTADAYGQKSKTWAAGSSGNGRMKIIKANQEYHEFGYLVPGDAIALIKLSFTVAQNDRLRHNGIDYDVIGIVQKKTHQEVACKRVP